MAKKNSKKKAKRKAKKEKPSEPPMSKGFGHLTIKPGWVIKDTGWVEGGEWEIDRSQDWGDWE